MDFSFCGVFLSNNMYFNFFVKIVSLDFSKIALFLGFANQKRLG
ncbi:hypothetical protein TDIS_1937 [Thermosulfurimonas dismutans]|uniref:Uncharacterized protein n=1 Tax=Thermosulfurimonas dismutans TaxID=999894 RepID=A0A179D2S7_9BACT|nr:hypothetical protein TDIS_1937 [Thermosulfurimonas dismutans]